MWTLLQRVVAATHWPNIYGFAIMSLHVVIALSVFDLNQSGKYGTRWGYVGVHHISMYVRPF